MYIVLEGPEASGKSTLAKQLTEYFLEQGREVFLTKEPGDPTDEVCVKIRELLLNPDLKINNKAALFLFLADRSQHMPEIEKALNEGKVVISDRSSLSSLVYYGAGEREGQEFSIAQEWKAMASYKKDTIYLLDAAQTIKPDLALITSVKLEEAKERLGSNLDRIEAFDEDYHKRVHAFFADPITFAFDANYLPETIEYLPRSSEFTQEHILEYAIKKIGVISEKKR